MNRPRLFLSAVSEELRTARKTVEATVRTLGFDPVSQDDFPTGYGELRQWLREQLDSCEGLIQLVGQGYGAEPPDVDPEYGRVSYTQFEFLYARHQKTKKTWIIVIGKDFVRDKPPDQLDLPRDRSLPNPAGYQAERRRLQQTYFTRLIQENHLRHTANNKDQLELIVLRLRDELDELRRQWDEWLQKDADFKVHAADRLDELAKASRLTTEKIRVHLQQTAEETHRRELAQAEADPDWKKRQHLREAADNAHVVRLSRIDELAASFAEIEGRGTGTSVFQEMTRILTEQGVDEAITYVGIQRSSIFKTVRARAAITCERNRADLQPLLQTAALYQAKGQSTEARTLYTDILTIEPDWPEALHAYFRFLSDQGNLARVRATIVEASREYEEAHLIAQRLTTSDPSHAQWQRDQFVSYIKLGDVAVAQGQLKKAARLYTEGLTVRKALAASELSNAQWQRDLSVGYERLGDVARAQGHLKKAARVYTEGLTVRKALAASDPTNAQWQRDLFVSYTNLGDVAVAQGQLEEAARVYTEGQTVVKTLAARDLSNAQWQDDLSLAYDRLGNVAVAQKQLEKAARAYGEGLTVRKALTVSDPNNTQWQRNLFVSYTKLGDVAVAQGQLKEAAQVYTEGQTVIKPLAVSDPNNTQWQHDLSVSYNKLGDVAVAKGQLKKAERIYAAGLMIAKTLAALDSTNSEWQRDLSEYYWELANLAERQKNSREAHIYWKQAFDVLLGIEQGGLHLSPEDRQALETLRKKLGDDTH